MSEGEAPTKVREHQWTEMTMQRVKVEGRWPDSGELAIVPLGGVGTTVSCVICYSPWSEEAQGSECEGEPN